MKIALVILFIILTHDARRTTLYASDGFFLGYKLSFYNLFSPDIYAFRRSHQFSFGYQGLPAGSSLINIEAQYNWIDEVKGSTSTHNLTAWVFNASGMVNQVSESIWISQDRVCLKYVYFLNLLSPWENRGVIGAEYRKSYGSGNFFGAVRAGIGFSRKFLPIYGINTAYLPTSNTNVNLKLNWLEDNEDNPEFLLKFPLALGYSGRFASQGPYDISNIGEGSGIEYVWDPAKSRLVTADGKLTYYWLKGYIGDKFWF
jgi:hypothetical protein